MVLGIIGLCSTWDFLGFLVIFLFYFGFSGIRFLFYWEFALRVVIGHLILWAYGILF